VIVHGISACRTKISSVRSLLLGGGLGNRRLRSTNASIIATSEIGDETPGAALNAHSQNGGRLPGSMSEQGAKAALGGRSAAAAETEKDHGIRQPERTLGRKSLEIEILKQFLGSRRLDMVIDHLSAPDEFRDFEMQRIERLPVGVVRPRKV
jgi:hypothetical protein